MHYKPTDSHSYLLHSSSHPAHVKNYIPYSQFLRLRRLCSDDTDFSDRMRKQRKCASSSRHAVIPIQLSTTANTAHSQSIRNRHHYRHTTNSVDGRIPLTLTFHPHNISVKNLISNKFQVTSTRSHHCRDFCATTPRFIQTGQKLKQFPSEKYTEI